MKQKLIIFTTLALILIFGIAFLKNDDKKSYEKVKASCNNEVVKVATKDGDLYYVCK